MNCMSHQGTPGQAIELPARRYEGLGERLQQLAWGDWNPAADSSQRTYGTYCQTQWNYFAQGRRNFEHHYNEISELFRMFREDEVKEHILIRLNKLRQAGQNQLSEENCNHMVDFAARIVAPVNIGTLPNEVKKRRHLEWKTGTLRSLFAEYFNEPPVLAFERLRLPKAFAAWSLCKVGGIKIRFTDNLADHLLLVDDDAVVMVFHHVSYLKQQGKESVPSSRRFYGLRGMLIDKQIRSPRRTGRGNNQDDRPPFPTSRI